MKNNFFWHLLKIALFGLITNVSANTTAGLVKPIEWQKLDLEKEIIARMQNGLRKYIADELFMINVDVVANGPEKPDFMRQIIKISGDVIEFSDEKRNQAPTDSLIFSKFGIEAPVPKPQNMSEIIQGIRISQIWDYNESMNLFNNIESIKIDIKVSDTVAKDIREKIKLLANEIKLPLVDIVVDISFSYVNYIKGIVLDSNKKIPLRNDLDKKHNDVKKNIKSSSPKPDLLDRLSKFSIMAGILMAAIVMAITFIFGRKQSREMHEAPSNDRDESAKATDSPNLQVNDKVTDSHSQSRNVPPDINDSINLAYQRFKIYLDHDAYLATSLIKEWLTGSKNDFVILKILADKLSASELEKIFFNLSQQQRFNWRSQIDTEVNLAQLIGASQQLNTRISAEIISPSVQVNKEISDLIFLVPPENMKKVIDEDFESGLIAMSIINKDFAAKVLGLLSADNVKRIVERTISFDIKSVLTDSSKLNVLVKILEKYKVSSTSLPGVDKVRSLLEIVPYQTEVKLWEVLKSNLSKPDLIQQAMTVFPSELIFMLKQKQIKKITKNMSLESKVEVLFSLQNDADVLLELFAPADTQMRDMLDLEMKKNNENITFQRKIKANATSIWMTFMQNTRQQIQDHINDDPEFFDVIESWANHSDNEAVNVLQEVA